MTGAVRRRIGSYWTMLGKQKRWSSLTHVAASEHAYWLEVDDCARIKDVEIVQRRWDMLQVLVDQTDVAA
jgi:hypothetical protein